MLQVDAIRLCEEHRVQLTHSTADTIQQTYMEDTEESGSSIQEVLKDRNRKEEDIEDREVWRMGCRM